MPTQQTIRYQRRLPIRYDVDVFVAGGGPAGMAAAVTAARGGASVYLAEAHVCFGGMGTAGMLPIFMPFGDRRNFCADGFGREVLGRLRSAGGMAPGVGENELAPRIRCEALKRVYDDLAADARFQFTFQTAFLDVQREGDRVACAICASKSGTFAVRARVFIDATGDGDLCARAGAPFEKGDASGTLQPGTLVSLWTDIDWSRAESNGHGIWRQESDLPRAFADKVFTIEDNHLPGIIPVGPHTGGGNVGHAFGVDGTDDRSLTKAILWARKSLVEYERYYREYLTGYEQAWLAATASLFGVRETRRITGDYVLSADDYASLATFDDEIGRYNYWIDIHPSSADKKDFADHVKWRTSPMKEGESYGIPYRTLTPRGLRNVLTAGRCVSTDHVVQASLRVMPGCYITGQAAGLAAALAARAGGGDVRAIDVRDLQRRLKAVGAFLPNFAERPSTIGPVVTPETLEPGKKVGEER